MKKRLLTRPILCVSCVAAIGFCTTASAVDEGLVIQHYIDMAYAGYSDSLASAQQLDNRIDALINQPNDSTLNDAREAWRVARVSYQQTEAFRFGNPIVDEWEGKVNAWPLDEGLIDYVAPSYGDTSDENPYYVANIIANPHLNVAGQPIDASNITVELLSDTLDEIDGVETNVARGYHAIEYLLWGQDLHGTGPGAGERPATDYNLENCTHGNCDRRASYLKAATTLLINDLEWMVQQWDEGGAARQRLIDATPGERIATILTGLGSLSYGELAGERMKLGLMLHDPEEEHDCFSDNTHWSHYYDSLGVRNVYTGTYVRPDGSEMKGPSLSALVAERDPDLDASLRGLIDATVEGMQRIVDSAVEDGVAYDQMIASGNRLGNATVLAAVNALVDQTRGFERVVNTLKLGEIKFEGSDSLDNPGAVSN
ncbi:MAG: peptidase [marine bacterium B5-7]|nr:MAG: peptidase [marine bacterium B5-7]